MKKKTPLLHRIMWIYKQVILIIFFAILSILLQMLPMRLSGGTGVCISLTLYTSVCELMMVQRQQQQQQHTHTHTRTRTHTHTHMHTQVYVSWWSMHMHRSRSDRFIQYHTGPPVCKVNRSTKMIFHKQGQISV